MKSTLIIVHGKGEDEFCHRTALILQRAIDKNITFNPNKCRLGLDRIDYLGHVIDSDGISFNNDKISKVMEFPTPTNSKQLRSFLGLANYFRDHIIREFSSLDRPMRNA